MSEELESEGKTVAEAVENALKKLGLPREQVEVQILQEAAPGILGFGSKPARVKIARKHWGASAPPDNAAPRRDRQGAGYPARQPRPATRHEPRQHAPEAAGRHSNPHATPHHRAERPAQPAQHAPQPDAPVRAPAVPPDPAKACAATDAILKELLTLMRFADAGIAARWDAEHERVKANVKTAESQRLIGPDGKALEAMQLLMTLMVGRRLGTPVAVQVDTNDYWQKKENEILSQALKGIEAVRNTGKPFRMLPMDAPMRRLIHKSLASHPDIMTTSEGDGPWRKIVLRPRK